MARILYNEEGLFRFWKGAQVIASGCIPAHACYFLTYEYLKTVFNYNNEELALAETVSIGCMTTFVHDLFITPSDCIKQRLQLCKNLSAS